MMPEELSRLGDERLDSPDNFFVTIHKKLAVSCRNGTV
jgi:hypothetical protein